MPESKSGSGRGRKDGDRGGSNGRNSKSSRSSRNGGSGKSGVAGKSGQAGQGGRRTAGSPPRSPRLQPPYDLAPHAPSYPHPPAYPRAQDELRYRRPQGGADPGGGRPVPPRAGRATVAARALLGSASAVALLVSGATWAAYHNLTSGLLTSDAINAIRSGEKGYVAPHLDGSVNLLLIGLDSRKDMDGNDLPTDFVEQELHAGSSEIGGYNTNVLILMHIPADGGRVTSFSIARDDYVEEPGGDSSVGEIPDLGMHKIKEAYGRAKGIAEQRLKDSGMSDKAQIEKVSREVGRESTIRAVQLLTGEHVDHLAEINLLGFYDIAKAVGPIEVCLNHPVDDPIEDGAGTGLKLPAGYSQLDAPTALQFVRQRFHLLRGDFDRNRRQQAFLSSVMHKLRDDGVIGDLGRMRDLFDVVKKDLVIDDAWDVLDFATRAQNLTAGNADFRELPITGQPVLPGDGSVNTVNPWQIRRIVTSAFGDVQTDPRDALDPNGDGPGTGPTDGASSPSPSPSPSPSNTDRDPGTPTAPHATGIALLVPAPPTPSANSAAPHTVVDVYNATPTRGMATSVADLLAAAGWPVDKTGGWAAQNHTTILYGKGAAKAADQLAEKLGVAALPAPSARTAAGHVVVRIGADYVPPADPGANPDDPSATASPAQPSPPPGIAMDNGITCVN
ncbi:LCP family protein [Catenulispora yoronensis]|uniref:LCP family protein n=1 Tax=Catenulispora yoronensis TaxID=450799 RepID=A0ABP5GS68_9ACTN